MSCLKIEIMKSIKFNICKWPICTNIPDYRKLTINGTAQNKEGKKKTKELLFHPTTAKSHFPKQPLPFPHTPSHGKPTKIFYKIKSVTTNGKTKHSYYQIGQDERHSCWIMASHRAWLSSQRFGSHQHSTEPNHIFCNRALWNPVNLRVAPLWQKLCLLMNTRRQKKKWWLQLHIEKYLCLFVNYI